MAETPSYMQAHFREQVKDTFDQQIQQTKSKFSDAGMVDPDWTADQIVFRESQPFSFVETTGQRGGNTLQGEFTAGFRSGFKQDFEAAILLDRNDKRKLDRAHLPDSEIQRDLKAAWERQMDDLFVSKAHAQSLGGEKPYITLQTLPTSMTVPVTWAKTTDPAGSNYGLTIFKILEAKKRMQVLDVDLDNTELILAISPAQQQSWILYAQSATNDIFAKLVAAWLEDPKKGILGARVIVTNKLTAVSTGIYRSLLFTKRAFKLSPMEFEIKIDELPRQRHAIQIAAYASIGCVRRWDEETKIIVADDAGLMGN